MHIYATSFNRLWSISIKHFTFLYYKNSKGNYSTEANYFFAAKIIRFTSSLNLFSPLTHRVKVNRTSYKGSNCLMFNDLKNLEEFCYFRTITTCMDHKNNPHMFSNENCIISDEKLTPEKQEKKIKVKKKAKEPGIIYLSRVPALMNVSIIRNMFNMYGEVGKIFLQPDGE